MLSFWQACLLTVTVKRAKMRAWKPTVNSEESQNEGMEANGQIEKFAIILPNYNF
jgi:hypothetical protein